MVEKLNKKQKLQGVSWCLCLERTNIKVFITCKVSVQPFSVMDFWWVFSKLERLLLCLKSFEDFVYYCYILKENTRNHWIETRAVILKLPRNAFWVTFEIVFLGRNIRMPLGFTKMEIMCWVLFRYLSITDWSSVGPPMGFVAIADRMNNESMYASVFTRSQTVNFSAGSPPNHIVTRMQIFSRCLLF